MMLWFIILGLLILMTSSLGWAVHSVADRFQAQRQRLFSENSESNLLKFLFQSAVLVMSHPAPSRARESAVLFQDLRLRSWRSNLLLAALSSLSLWLPLLIVLSVYRVSGLFTLALGGLALGISSFFPILRGVAGVVMGWGGFLFLLENTSRMGNGLFTMGGMELFSMLSDGRPLAVLILFLVGVLIAAGLGLQFILFSTAVWLLSMGWISLSGAVMLWAGERMGLALRTWIRSRRMRTGPRRVALISVGATAVGSLVGFILLGFFRDLMVASPGFSQEGPRQVLISFVFLSILVEGPVLMANMIWGHFAALKPPDDIFEAGLGQGLEAMQIHEAGLIRASVQGLREREKSLKGIRRELNDEDWQKIPPGIRSVSQDEERAVEATIARMHSHLLSRASGFVETLR